MNDTHEVKHVEKGQVVFIRPERLNPGETGGSFLAIERSDWGRVRCRAIGTGLDFPPIETVRFSDIERVVDWTDEVSAVGSWTAQAIQRASIVGGGFRWCLSDYDIKTFIKRRQSFGLSRYRLATLACVSPSDVRGIENGQACEPLTLAKCTTALAQLELDELLGGPSQVADSEQRCTTVKTHEC